jgi:hypothetical protein
MRSERADIPIVAFSVRAYQALLIAYPAKFQQEYGSQMVQVFQDCCLRTVRQKGTNGMIKLWAVTLLDLLQSAISEHAHKEIEMKKEMKPEDIRMAGWALIWGAVAFIIGILLLAIGGPKLWGISVILTHILGMPLLVVGILGVQNRYGDKVGSVGRNILWVGVVFGSLITFIGFFGLSYSLESLSLLFIIGPAALFVCLALFGLVALYMKPLPRWNIAPLLAGIWYPILIVAYIMTSINTGDWDGSSDTGILGVVSIVLCVIQGMALVALGYILKSDVPEEAAASA